MRGANGFVGSNLCRRFRENGWEIIALGRKEFALSTVDLAKHLQGVDVIVNLAGAPVIGRWTEAYKEILYESRITLTRKLVSACILMEKTPRVFLSASAIGCYSTTGTHTEDDHVLADNFTAVFRFGVVLGRGGGALAKMLFPFKLNLVI